MRTVPEIRRELVNHRERADELRNWIEEQISTFSSTGVRAEGEAFNNVKSALRAEKRTMAILRAELEEVDSPLGRPQQEARRFREAARDLLPAAKFREIEREAGNNGA